MKKILSFFACLLLFTWSLNAQGPTLTVADFPQVGDILTTQEAQASGVSFGTAGAGQTWDYSNLVDSGSATILSYVSPAATPFAADFPGANLAADLGDLSYSYYAATPGGIRILGVGANDVRVFYNSINYVYPLPISYGDFFTDTVVQVLSGSVNQVIAGRDSIWAEGYGTLILPGNNVFNNVLRIKTVYLLRDTITESGISTISTVHTTSVSYATPGYHGSLLNISQVVVTTTIEGTPIPFPISTTSSLSVSYATNVVLPLRFVSFNGRLQQQGVGLQWQTAQETNTDHFNVQRSLNGADFTNIGKVKANGNANLSDYSYEDNTIDKINTADLFYRLQEVDRDGKDHYSGMVVIKRSGIGTGKLYPNPASNSFYLNIPNSAANGSIADAVSIYDMNGRLVKQWQRYPVNQLIDISTLPSGNYTVQVRIKGATTTSKIRKQ